MTWPLLSKRVLYALKVLSCLASAQGPTRARELARCTGIPPAEAAKILYLLTWRGLVSSRRGSKGGFWLRVPSHRIRVRDVMEFFHPPVDHRRKDANDPILQIWDESAAPGRQTFEQLTIAELMKEENVARCSKLLGSAESDWRFFA